MLVSALFVVLMTAHAEVAAQPTDACTQPLLSYTFDSAQPGDYSTVTCLVCAHSTTWHVMDADGEKRVVTRSTVDISQVASAVEQVRQGNVFDTLARDIAPTVFYWAHPSDGPKFLLKASQQSRRWTNDSQYTSTLVDAIDAICGAQL